MFIVHCIFSFKIGGSENMLVDIVNEQCKTRKVKLIIVNDDVDELLIGKIDKSIDVVCIHRKKSSRNVLDIVRLNYHLFVSQPIIIHCHNHNLINLFLPRFRGISVLTVHDVGVDTVNFNLYSKLFAISKSVQSDILSRTGLQSKLIYNGININNIVTRSFNKNISFQIVQVSRLYHLKKGQDLALRALRVLKDEGLDDINMSFIGSGESEKYLKDLSKELEVEDRVVFITDRDREFIYDNLRSFDLLIQPSRFEGFGLTVVEAMAAKLPVLVSNIDGPMEIIEGGKFGFYFSDGDIKDFAEMIKFIKFEKNVYEVKYKTDAAYKYVFDNFNIKVTASKYLLNY